MLMCLYCCRTQSYRKTQMILIVFTLFSVLYFSDTGLLLAPCIFYSIIDCHVAFYITFE